MRKHRIGTFLLLGGLIAVSSLLTKAYIDTDKLSEHSFMAHDYITVGMIVGWTGTLMGLTGYLNGAMGSDYERSSFICTISLLALAVCGTVSVLAFEKLRTAPDKEHNKVRRHETLAAFVVAFTFLSLGFIGIVMMRRKMRIDSGNAVIYKY